MQVGVGGTESRIKEGRFLALVGFNKEVPPLSTHFLQAFILYSPKQT